MWLSRQRVARLLLLLLTAWALAMVVPDLQRLIRPLGSFGLYANNDGLIIDVRGEFAEPEASPALRAGLRPGDRLDLAAMRCVPLAAPRCATAQAVLGGLRLVEVGTPAKLAIAASAGRPARDVDIVALPRPFTLPVLATLLTDQLAAIAVILAAAWLVLTRPGPMTWGFFLYVIWFNPGQSDAYYAFLQQSPSALLAQNLLGALAEGAGYAGFILFALRVPRDEIADRWKAIERLLPAVALILGALLALSYANLLGYPTELVTRLGIASGLLVVASVFAILVMRRGELPPADYQRLRWVIYGCLVGLPAIILADIGQGTSLLDGVFGDAPPPEEVWGLIRLVNGVLCLFVFEAVRRPRVVAVSIPLRRVTILGILLSVPALIAHEQISHLREDIAESITLPAWAWFAITVVFVFLISRLHEGAVHVTDRHLNRSLARAGEKLGEAVLAAPTGEEAEALLVRGPIDLFRLTSACLFRKEGDFFRRGPASEAWSHCGAVEVAADDPVLQALSARRPFDVSGDVASRVGFPIGHAQPVLAVPVADRFRCYAFALYGSHASGNDLTHEEQELLAELADKAASVLAKLENEALRLKVAELERKLMREPSQLSGSSLDRI